MSFRIKENEYRESNELITTHAVMLFLVSFRNIHLFIANRSAARKLTSSCTKQKIFFKFPDKAKWNYITFVFHGFKNAMTEIQKYYGIIVVLNIFMLF